MPRTETMARARPSVAGPASVLLDRLGPSETARVVLAALRVGLTARPFAALPRSQSARERKSRRQALPAVLLYRALGQVVGRERALAIAHDVIVAGGVAFLTKTLGDLDVASVLAMTPRQRDTRVSGWLARFFTATTELERAMPAGEAAFIVTRCELVRLVSAAGHPELAPAFCASDDAYFRARTPPVVLERPATIARGDAVCRFRFRVDGEGVS